MHGRRKQLVAFVKSVCATSTNFRRESILLLEKTEARRMNALISLQARRFSGVLKSPTVF